MSVSFYFQAGVAVAFASDWPVDAIDPMLGMFVAVHRRAPHIPPPQSWHPEGGVTPEQAMVAHTQGAAHACGLESQVGLLK